MVSERLWLGLPYSERRSSWRPADRGFDINLFVDTPETTGL